MANYVRDLRKVVGSQPIILPGSTIIIQNEKGEILFQHRSDTNTWGLPGGAMELGESFKETAQRELLEETGLEAESFELIGLFSGKDYYFKYPNGDEIYTIIAAYKAMDARGELKLDGDESLGLKYFAKDNYPILESRAKRLLEEINHLL